MLETYLDMFQDFVSRRGNGLPHFLRARNLDLKNFPCQFMYQIGKDNSTCGFTCFITALSSVLSTVLTGRSSEPIQMAISSSAFSCFSSVSSAPQLPFSQGKLSMKDAMVDFQQQMIRYCNFFSICNNC